MATPTGTTSSNTITEQLDNGSGTAPSATLASLLIPANPANAAAAALGVPISGMYTTSADPHILYVRTA